MRNISYEKWFLKWTLLMQCYCTCKRDWNRKENNRRWGDVNRREIERDKCVRCRSG